MGTILDQVCCIEASKASLEKYSPKLLSHTTQQNSLYSSRSFLRKLPCSEIRLFPARSEENVHSIDNLPINTLNIIRKQSGSPMQFYHTLDELGCGTYGHVFKVIHKKTGHIRSMKVIPKNNWKLGFTEEEIVSEINILKQLDHPQIIKIFEFYSDDYNYYIINEYCSEGDLAEKWQQLKCLPEVIVKVLMFQIFSSVSYLHSQRVIHGDLKLENIMLDSNWPNDSKSSFVSTIQEDTKWLGRNRSSSVCYMEPKPNGIMEQVQKRSEIDIRCRGFDQAKQHAEMENKSPRCFIKKSPTSKLKNSKLKHFDLKWIDFGCSKIFTQYKKNFEDTIGTLSYCSPEVLANSYNEKCDVWSCGVIMYILLSGRLPFPGRTDKEITDKILKGHFEFTDIHGEISPDAKDWITKCLTYDRDKRITVKEALKHQFFVNDINPNNIFEDKINTKEVWNNLQKFSKHSKFYQAVLTFLSHNFAEKAEWERIKKIFLTIDLNWDGKISKKELIHAYKIAGFEIKKEQIDSIFNSIDFDNNGTIEYAEFIRATIPRETLFTEENLKMAFDWFDLDKNGGISRSELEKVWGGGRKIDENVIQELLLEIKKTGDEEITFAQFKDIINEFVNEDTNWRSSNKSMENTNTNADSIDYKEG